MSGEPYSLYLLNISTINKGYEHVSAVSSFYFKLNFMLYLLEAKKKKGILVIFFLYLFVYFWSSIYINNS